MHRGGVIIYHPTHYIFFYFTMCILLNTNLDGELSEWFKEAVLKTVDLNGSESSNLSLSANDSKHISFSIEYWVGNIQNSLSIHPLI